MSDSSRDNNSGGSFKSLRNRLQTRPNKQSFQADGIKKGFSHISDVTKNMGATIQNMFATKSDASVYSKGVRELDNFGYEKYNIDDDWEETEYGNYVDGKLVFESGFEATVTDKIEGTWKDNDAGYSKMPFVLNFVGSVLVDGAFIYPSAPQIAETLAIVDDGAEKKPEKKDTNAIEPPAVEIQYLPPTVEGKETVDDNRVYDVVEEMPEFPGGWSALLNFLATNMKYPKDCQEAGIQGRVVVKFVVDKDGRVTNARVAQPVNPSLDKEALRVINSMPRWAPGKQKGKPVRVTYTVPLMFRLK